MAKISELDEEHLKLQIERYERKILAGGDDVERNKKVLSQLRLALKKFEKQDSSVAKERTPKKPVPVKKVRTHHSQKIDYSAYADAGFGIRLIAFVIDFFLICILDEVLVSTLGMLISSGITPFLLTLMVFINIFLMVFSTSIYTYFFLRKNGQTPGKKLLNIKIISLHSNDKLSFGTIFLREVLGKFLSVGFLAIGCIVRLFGVPTWHDRIAKTRVIKLD